MNVKFRIMLFCVLISTYTISQNKSGCISGDCNNGKGVFIFPNGDKYEGDFENQLLKGFGVYTDVYGNVYTGKFSGNKFNGVGTFVKTDGTKYIGEFLNGKRHGLGIQWYSQTYKEKGKWENDRFIENAEFEDFVVAEEYNFCDSFLKIFMASANGFNSVKGNRVSEYISDAYQCNEKIKEFSLVEISEKNIFSGIYCKGAANECNARFEELKNIVSECLKKSCCSFQNKSQNTATEKKYEFLPVQVINDCSTNLLKSKITIVYISGKSSSEVKLIISGS